MITFFLLWALLDAVILWPHHTLVQDGAPYLTRWPLLGGDGCKRAPWPLGKAKRNVFLHWIRASDGPQYHNHPYHRATSLILWGSYLESRRQDFGAIFGGKPAWIITTKTYRPGMMNRIFADTFHTLELLTPFALTLFWTSEKTGKGWGFMVNGKYLPASGLGGNARDVVDELSRRNS